MIQTFFKIIETMLLVYTIITLIADFISLATNTVNGERQIIAKHIETKAVWIGILVVLIYIL